MKSFIDWLNSLTPEIIIIFSVLFILIILLIIVLNRISVLKKNLIKDSLVLSEDMLINDSLALTRIKITNSSFYNVVIHEYGFMQKNIKHSSRNERMIIEERNDITQNYESDYVREIFKNNEEKSFKNIYLYVIDSNNKVKKKKLKMLNKYIKANIKSEKREIKADAKALRFEKGNYNFGERLAMILGIIVSPITKLWKLLTIKTNNSLHKRNKKKNTKYNDTKQDEDLPNDYEEQNEGTKELTSEDFTLQIEEEENFSDDDFTVEEEKIEEDSYEDYLEDSDIE